MKSALAIGITMVALTLHARVLADGTEAGKYRDRMVQVQDLQYDLSDAITQKSSGKAIEASEKIRVLLQEDLDYWIKQKIDDAIGYGKSSVNYSSALAEDAKKQDFAAAMATYNKLQSTCRSCHDAHPEKRAKAN
jgi:nitrate/TMAO reductase-like tetraheme cytochrome c subunit